MHVNLHSLSYAAYVIIFIVGYSFSQVWSCRAAVAYIILRNISKELTHKLWDMQSFLQIEFENKINFYITVDLDSNINNIN